MLPSHPGDTTKVDPYANVDDLAPGCISSGWLKADTACHLDNIWLFGWYSEILTPSHVDDHLLSPSPIAYKAVPWKPRYKFNNMNNVTHELLSGVIFIKPVKCSVPSYRIRIVCNTDEDSLIKK